MELEAGPGSSSLLKQPRQKPSQKITLFPAGTEEDLKGIRVVRGRDFDSTGEDCALEDPNVGGKLSSEGVVGTITGLNLITGQIMTTWDSGHRGEYCGTNGKFDLRVFDSAPSAKCYFVTCSGNDQCESKIHKSIHGIVFRCRDCPKQVYLCTECYMRDEHNVAHKFTRHDEGPDIMGVDLPSRKSASANQRQSRGIFKGTEVERGPDWKNMDSSDGGKGNSGLVQEIVWYKNAGKSAAFVKWKGMKDTSYKLAVGQDGLMKLKYTKFSKAKAGWPYYIDHLPHVPWPAKVPLISKAIQAKGKRAMKSEPGTKTKVIADTMPGKKRKLKEILDAKEREVEAAPTKRLAVATTGTKKPKPVKLTTRKGRSLTSAEIPQHSVNMNNNTIINNINNINNIFVQQRFSGCNFLTPQQRFELLNCMNENFPQSQFGEVLRPGDSDITWHRTRPGGGGVDNQRDQSDNPEIEIEQLFKELSLSNPRAYEKGKGLPVLVNWEFKNVKTKLPKIIRSNKERYELYKILRREGAEKDTDIIRKCLKDLTGNDVMVGLNLEKRKDVQEFFTEVAKKALEIGAAYIVIVISSHGLKDINSTLVITDHLETVCPYQDMIYQLKLDLPILCFMQLCQTQAAADRNHLTFEDASGEEVRPTGNFFVLMATIPLQPAWRHETMGSYFILAMAQFLKKDTKLPGQFVAMHNYLKSVLESDGGKRQVLNVHWPMEFPLGSFEF